MMMTGADNLGANRGLPWALAGRLAGGQIVSWGLLYYGFTVMAGPMHAGTGWSRTFLNVGLSLGLLTWGVCAYPVGLWIQRRGARELMTGASLLGGAALVLLGVANSPAAYLGAWVLLGAAMAGTLYEPAFAVVTAAFGEHYRKGITLITLVGGLASTVFVPVAQLVTDELGWRTALVVLGVGQALGCASLHWWSIPPQRARVAAAGAERVGGRVAGWWRTFRADLADPRFVGLAGCFAAHSAAFTGIIFLLIPIWQARGVASETIVTTIAIMGPMQVVGRLFLSTRGDDYTSLGTGLFAMGVLLGAVFVLLGLPPTPGWLGLFAAAFGLGNGMLTIVRGTAVAELFGRERYAEINGALSAPGVVARAGAPLLLAGIWAQTGDPRSVPLVVAAVLVGGLIALWRVRRSVARAVASG